MPQHGCSRNPFPPKTIYRFRQRAKLRQGEVNPKPQRERGIVQPWIRTAQTLYRMYERERHSESRKCRVTMIQFAKLGPQVPGSSTVEHSAVNRRVASSNLARGANFPQFSNAYSDFRFLRAWIN